MNAPGISPTTRETDAPGEYPSTFSPTESLHYHEFIKFFFFLTDVHPAMFTGAAFDPFRKPKARSVDPGRTRPRNGDSSLYVLVDVWIYVYICMCIYIYICITV